MARSTDHQIQLQTQAARLFSPRVPISRTELFAGRSSQILKMFGAINQPGAHAIIYGERGVGKTSLANVAPISFAFEESKPILTPRINCDGTDNYEHLWKKVFEQIDITSTRVPMGFRSQDEEETHSLSAEIDAQAITPGLVQRILESVGRNSHLVVILDEFDRLPDEGVPRLVADTIKCLSDNRTAATIVVVGVGDSIATLVKGHESVGRHLVEVPLPRMRRDELEKIIQVRLSDLELTIDEPALRIVSLVCSGLPYYTHLLGQHAACAAIDADSDRITKEHVTAAMERAIQDSEREMKRTYYEATHSRQPNCTFAHTLAACAMAAHDEFGYFTAGDIRTPLSKVRKAETDIPTFIGHLSRFANPNKSGILQSFGEKHQTRYRFRDPLMQPFVIIKSLESQIVGINDLKESAVA